MPPGPHSHLQAQLAAKKPRSKSQVQEPSPKVKSKGREQGIPQWQGDAMRTAQAGRVPAFAHHSHSTLDPIQRGRARRLDDRAARVQAIAAFTGARSAWAWPLMEARRQRARQ